MRHTTMVILLLLVAGAAFSQVAEIGASGGAALLSNATLSNPPDVPAKLDSGFRMGFRVTLNTGRMFGHEVGYAYNRTNLDYGGTVYGMSTHQGFYDFLLYATPEGAKIRPFIAGGVQFCNFVPPGGYTFQGKTKFGVNYGGGVKVKVATKFLVRFDFRQYASPKPDFLPTATAPQGWLRLTEVSAGFAYTL